MSKESDARRNAPEATATLKRASGRERTETFAPTGPVRAEIFSRSGDVVVRAVEGNQLEVTLRANSSKSEHLLMDALIRFDSANSRLEIQTQPRDIPSSFRGLRSSAKSWFDFGSADLDVFVVVPLDSSLDVKTMSGDVTLDGVLGDVDVASASGDVRGLATCRTLDVKTASGDVDAGTVLEVLKCRSASGDVRSRSAATKTDIAGASGDVDLTVGRSGIVDVKVVSGDVRVRVARGLVVDVNANTVSGDLTSNIDFDASSGPSNDDEVLYLKVNTVSGDVRVDKAS